MKSQSLPMQTIVLIILIIIVLATVLLFFFSTFAKNKQTTDVQTFISHCNTIASQIQGDYPKTFSDVETDAGNKGFCDPNPSLDNKNCGNYVNPVIHASNGDCRLNCTSSGATCQSI